jgi:ketosteroid isomerase-like protein
MTGRCDRPPMTSIHSHTTLDGATLRRAFSDRDSAALTALYADDATIEIADAQNTPSAPLKVEGRDAIRGYFADIFAARHDPRGRTGRDQRR